MISPISQSQEEALAALADFISASPHNLVARGDRATVREVHITECAALHPVLRPSPGDSWVDVGTGGGLPGLVLAVLEPAVAWTLVDSTRKKVGAVRGFADALGLDNVEVVVGRAERLAHDRAYREQFDGAISRAVAGLPTLVELCRGFVRPGGRLVAVKGPRWNDELAAAAEALAALRLGAVHSEEIASAQRPTWVVTMKALGPTPAAYPRREGRPRSHPLGGNPR